MASGLISSILKATGDWLSLIQSTSTASSTSTSVADDLEKLQRMLERIKAVLQDAEEREIVDKSVKLWLKEIKDVAYDAEDLLDEYQYHVLQAQVENLRIEEAAAAKASRKRKYMDGKEEVMALASSSSASNLAVSKISILSRMADRIKKIRKRFKEISKDRDRLQLKPEDGQRRHDNIYEYPPPTTHMVKEQEIYGREIDRENLINLLLSNKESKFEVVAVVGKGGLGKTTLAQLVYNDQKVTKYFQQRMWICVSNDFNPIKLTRAIIESITGTSCTLSDQLSLLQETLQKELQEKRVLLVLDDVWNERKDLWESLSFPFHDTEIMRIVVTTRNIPVAEVMQTTDSYHLGYLPQEQCRNLFMHHAFYRREPEEFPLLVDIGKKIVEKCGGLPLAVKSLGGLLQHERDEDRWKDVLESGVWQSDEKTGILPALKLSYIRLPSHLKPCFEICCMFPKDYEFNKDELVKLWVAHGYIQHKVEKKSMEEIGHMYFNELYRRSFFDVYYAKKFKMHDNIHDLAYYVQVETDLSNDNKHKIRHLSIREYYKSLKFNLDDTGALRTLLVVHSNTIAINDMLWTNVGRLTHLRYLSIRLYSFEDVEILLPEEIGNLICLRHFQLNIHGKIKVPKSIGNLYNLAVLEITSDELIAQPETLRNLVSLTTIEFDGFKIDQLPPLGQLPSLRSLTLRNFDNVRSIGNEFYNRGVNHPHRVAFSSLTSLAFKKMKKWRKWDEFQAGDFPRLEKLTIHDCEVLSSTPSLRNFHLLSHLSLQQCDSLQLSPEVQFPPNLKTLENFRVFKMLKNPCLPIGFREMKKLEKIRGIFGVRTERVFGILKKLVNLNYLFLSELRNAHYALNGQDYLRECTGIERLVLNWSNDNYSALEEEEVLHLAFERGHNEGSEGDSIQYASNTENASFSLLDNLQPHANLKDLEIKHYDGERYPNWIGDPSFNNLTSIHLVSNKIVQLPTLGQLPFLNHLSLFRISSLEVIGDEFYRDINKSRNDTVAFPSLIKLELRSIYDLMKWHNSIEGDFPRLQILDVNECSKLQLLPDLQNFHSLLDLSIERCPLIQLPSNVSFLLPNLRTLTYRECGMPRTCFSHGGKLLKLQRLIGKFVVGKDELFEILKNIDVDNGDLNLTGLKKVCNIREVEADLKRQHQLRRLGFYWNDADFHSLYYGLVHDIHHNPNDGLVLAVGDDDYNDDDKTRETSFYVLEKLQPHTNIEFLRIEDYDGIRYPSWIGHPSFNKLTQVHLHGCNNDHLPTFGQLPHLNSLHLVSIFGLQKIEDEFCRGINSNSDNVVAFPSLSTLSFSEMHDLIKWDGVRPGDFRYLVNLKIEGCPKLSSLPDLRNLNENLHSTIRECPNIHISVGSESCEPRICLAVGEKLLMLGNLRGVFETRNDDLFVILNILPVSTKEITIAALRNVRIVTEGETNFKNQHELKSLTLRWPFLHYGYISRGLSLVVVEDDVETNQTDKASFLVLEKLQPHTNLEELEIEGYDGVGYPSWIGHPSFNKLTSVHLRGFGNDQLPTLGQLPSLKSLELYSFSHLKRIGKEFCRPLMNNQRDEDKVAFPSLRRLFFQYMHAWEKWDQVLDGDFPQLQTLIIINSPSLHRELISLPLRLLELMYLE